MEEETKQRTVPKDVGVQREWLEAILKGRVDRPKTWTPADVKQMVAVKPKSRLQEIIQQIYWDLLKLQQVMKFTEGGEIIEQPEEDYFDGWYDANDLESYNQKYNLMQLLNTIARALHIPESDAYAKEDFTDILSRFVNRVLEEPVYLEKLAEGMKGGSITRVTITPTQEAMLKDAFRNQNTRDKKQRLLRNRPLVIMRDMETLARFVNVIATVNFSKRTINENGELEAKDEDIEKAIQLWESLINLRVELYGRSNRNFMSTGDEILAYTMRMQKIHQNEGDEAVVPVSEVKAEIVDRRRLVGKTTFYKELQTLRESGQIVQYGKREGNIAVVIK